MTRSSFPEMDVVESEHIGTYQGVPVTDVEAVVGDEVLELDPLLVCESIFAHIIDVDVGLPLAGLRVVDGDLIHAVPVVVAGCDGRKRSHWYICSLRIKPFSFISSTSI